MILSRQSLGAGLYLKTRQRARGISFADAYDNLTARPTTQINQIVQVYKNVYGRVPTDAEQTRWLRPLVNGTITPDGIGMTIGMEKARAEEQASVQAQAVTQEQQARINATDQIKYFLSKYNVTRTDSVIQNWVNQVISGQFTMQNIENKILDIKAEMQSMQRGRDEDVIADIFIKSIGAQPTADDFKYWIPRLQQEGEERIRTLFTASDYVKNVYNQYYQRKPYTDELREWTFNLLFGTKPSADLLNILSNPKNQGIELNSRMIEKIFADLNWPVDKSVIAEWADKVFNGKITIEQLKDKATMDLAYAQINGVFGDLIGRPATENEKGGLFILMRDIGLKDIKTYVLNLRQLINQMYQALLARDADTSGMDYWFENLLLKNKTLNDMKNTIIGSDEYKTLHPAGTPIPVTPTAPAGTAIGWLAIAGTVALLLL